MEKKEISTKEKHKTEKKISGGKAARVKRMRRGNTRTEEIREENSESLYGVRDAR